MQVDIYSDVVCPWCYIGKRRIERALAGLAADPMFTHDVVVRYRPFQLDPSARRDRTESVVDAYARKFGGFERAALMIERVSAAAAAEGIEFRLERAQRTNTADAHRLLGWALEQGGPNTQAALKESLLQAYFTDGENVGDFDVLVARAERCGLDPEGAREMLEDEVGVEALAVARQRAAENAITAVPTYVIGNRWSIAGAQDPGVFDQVLRRLAVQLEEPRPT
jgi:predicted DsbA family dithiol-disulfide isomerase